MVERNLFGVNRICWVLGLSKKTYYQCQSPDKRYSQKYEYLKEFLRQVIDKHPQYGVNRIKADLLYKFKLTIGRDALAKLLHIWELSLPRRINKSPLSGIQKILCRLADRANLLIRMTVTSPLQVITSDATELIYNHGKNKLYLVTHKDVYGQMVYGHTVGAFLDTALVITSLKKCQQHIEQLTGEVPPQDLVYHQDRGSVYTSYDYVAAVMAALGKLSYSDPGTPTHNPGQESFYGRLKDEHKDEIYELETQEEVEAFVIKILNDYNQDRLHTSINNQAPFNFTKTFLKNPFVQCTVFRD
jgi:putative transposase